MSQEQPVVSHLTPEETARQAAVETAEPSEEWLPLPPAHLPRPTYWPVVMALGIAFLAWGVVTTVAISAVGLVLFGLALSGWIVEVRHGGT